MLFAKTDRDERTAAAAGRVAAVGKRIAGAGWGSVWKWIRHGRRRRMTTLSSRSSSSEESRSVS